MQVMPASQGSTAAASLSRYVDSSVDSSIWSEMRMTLAYCRTLSSEISVCTKCYIYIYTLSL
ncbi:unnamed protein product [Musa hybrid cultivar]